MATPYKDLSPNVKSLPRHYTRLSRQLVPEFGRGFEEKNLRRMVQFAEVFPDPEIVATLRRQLGWSHFKEIIPLKNDLQRDL